MCGISGTINLDGRPASEAELSAMNLAQAHRGPDGEGVWTSGAVGLAHRRLSIIDVGGGAQPLSNEDGSVWITFNGEIYNFKELRAELEGKGHVFKTQTDTEAIVHLYEEAGAACVGRLNGMFAFAIFDVKRRSLLLARDRAGKKPLLYFHGPARFAFASEMEALRKAEGFPDKLNFRGIHDYFSLQYIPCPATAYEGVFKLPPGHLLEISLDGKAPSVRRWWSCRYDEKRDIGYGDAKAHLRELVEDSVRRRMISDVPLGAFLSGGLDSTIVAGVMSKVSGRPVKTFTIGFDVEGYDERPFAKAAAAKFATAHHERLVDPADFAAVEMLVRRCGEPYADSSILPTYLLSRFTRENVTVALSGDGADELFAGYYRYLAFKLASFADMIPAAIRRRIGEASSLIPSGANERTRAGKAKRFLKSVSSEPDRRYFEIISRFDQDLKIELYGDRFGVEEILPDTSAFIKGLYSAATARDPVEKLMECDFLSYLPDDILAKVDIASMACSLEVRSPFLDYRIIEFAASLPIKFKQDGATRKKILAETFADMLPQETARRPKLGFGVPVADWFRGAWNAILKERLLDGRAVRNSFLKKDAVENLISSHSNGSSDNSYPLWALLVFELWLENTGAA